MTTMSAAIKQLEAGGGRVVIEHDLKHRRTRCAIFTQARRGNPYLGEAKCRDEDTWDFEYGANLAFFRALALYYVAVNALSALLYNLHLNQADTVMKMDAEMTNTAKPYTMADYEAWARRRIHAEIEADEAGW